MTRKNMPGWLVGIVLFIGALAWYGFTGPVFDDIPYSYSFTYTKPLTEEFILCHGEPVTTFQQAFSSTILHNKYWGNSRLWTLPSFLIGVLPPWLWAILNASALTTMFLLSMRLALGRGWKSRPLGCMTIALLLWVVLPWDEFMLCTAFSLNYIYSAVLYLLLFKLVMQRQRPVWAVCLLALVAGMAHEGLAMGMNVLLFIVCVRELLRRGWQTPLMLPCLFFFVGSMAVTFSPTIVNRTGGGFSFAGFNGENLMHLFTIRECFFTFVVLMLPVLRMWLGREVFKQRLGRVWPMIVAALFSYLPQIFVAQFTERSAWCGDLFLIIAFVYLLCGRGLPWRSIYSRMAAGALLLLMAVWMSGVAFWCYKLRVERDEFVQLLDSTDSPILYGDITYRAALPWWTLYLPLGVHETYCGMVYSHYRNRRLQNPTLPEWGGDRMLLPEKYRHMALDTITPLPGNMQAIKIGTVLMRTKHPYYKENYIYFEEPTAESPSYGQRVPWVEWRQRRLRPLRLAFKVNLNRQTVPVTEQMRRDSIVLNPDVDTLYFYTYEPLNFPRQLFGLAATGADTLPPKPDVFDIKF